MADTDGTYELTLTDDATACERAGSDGDLPTFTPGGLALLWSGAQTCANIRMAGLLTGGTAQDDAVLDAACAGLPLHVRDYF